MMAFSISFLIGVVVPILGVLLYREWRRSAQGRADRASA
jgi:hypothetical protein